MNRRTFVRVMTGAAALGGAALSWEAAYVEPRSVEFTRSRIPGAGTTTLRLAHSPTCI